MVLSTLHGVSGGEKLKARMRANTKGPLLSTDGWLWGTRRLRPSNIKRKKNISHASLHSLTKMYRGAFNPYPCTMKISDLSTNTVTLDPGVYITSARDCEMGTIRNTLHELRDDFWDTLKRCGARKQITASGNLALMVFCHWTSSLYNSKLIAAFCQTVQDTLTITINSRTIVCSAFNITSPLAKNLLDTVACVVLANGLVLSKGPIGDACVEVTTTDIGRFSVSLTVQVSPSYMDEVKMNEGYFNTMYGHLVAEFQ